MTTEEQRRNAEILLEKVRVFCIDKGWMPAGVLLVTDKDELAVVSPLETAGEIRSMLATYLHESATPVKFYKT